MPISEVFNKEQLIDINTLSSRKIMAYSRKDAIKRLKHKKLI